MKTSETATGWYLLFWKEGKNWFFMCECEIGKHPVAHHPIKDAHILKKGKICFCVYPVVLGVGRLYCEVRKVNMK